MSVGVDTVTLMADELTDLERAVLAIEKQRWQYTATKHQAVLDRTGLSPGGYYQLVNQLIDDPRAMKVEPTLCSRLRRLREQRRRHTPAARSTL